MESTCSYLPCLTWLLTLYVEATTATTVVTTTVVALIMVVLVLVVCMVLEAVTLVAYLLVLTTAVVVLPVLVLLIASTALLVLLVRVAVADTALDQEVEALENNLLQLNITEFNFSKYIKQQQSGYHAQTVFLCPQVKICIKNP